MDIRNQFEKADKDRDYAKVKALFDDHHDLMCFHFEMTKRTMDWGFLAADDEDAEAVRDIIFGKWEPLAAAQVAVDSALHRIDNRDIDSEQVDAVRAFIKLDGARDYVGMMKLCESSGFIGAFWDRLLRSRRNTGHFNVVQDGQGGGSAYEVNSTYGYAI